MLNFRTVSHRCSRTKRSTFVCRPKATGIPALPLKSVVSRLSDPHSWQRYLMSTRKKRETRKKKSICQSASRLLVLTPHTAHIRTSGDSSVAPCQPPQIRNTLYATQPTENVPPVRTMNILFCEGQRKGPLLRNWETSPYSGVCWFPGTVVHTPCQTKRTRLVRFLY